MTDFAKLLLEKLDLRRKSLLKNAAILTAIYLDPRVRFNISENEVLIAKMTLEKLHKKIREIVPPTSSDSNSSSDDANEAEDSFEAYLASKAAEKAVEPQQTNSIEMDFFEMLRKFEAETPFHNQPVLSFWESQKDVFPELYVLASVINSIPPTQATVERSFSMLNFVYTCRRHNLGQKMLRDILTIKLNADIVKQINQRDLQQIDLENTDTNSK